MLSISTSCIYAQDFQRTAAELFIRETAGDEGFVSKAPVLKLEDAVSAAMHHFGERKIRLLQEMKSAYAVDEAKAGMLPTIDFQTTSTYMFNPPEGVVLPKGAMGYEPNQYSQAPVPFPEEDYPMMEDPAHTYFSIETDLQQPLFTWGKLRAGLDMAKMNQRLAELETEETEAELIKRVRAAYYGISFARRAEENLNQVKSLLQQILEDREKEYREDLINLQTVFEAQKDILVLETKIAEIHEKYTNAADGFFLLTGLSARLYDFEELPVYPVSDSPQPGAVFEKYLYRSPDVRKAAVQENLAGLNKLFEQRSGQLRPDFFLNIGFEIQGDQVPVLQPNWIETWNVNLTITLGTAFTLWDSGLSLAQRRQAAVSEQIAAEGLKQKIWNAENTMRGLIERLNVAGFQIREHRSKRMLLEEQLKNAEVSYANDLISRSERLGALAAVLQNEVEYLSSLLEYDMILAELSALSGGHDFATDFGTIQ